VVADQLRRSPSSCSDVEGLHDEGVGEAQEHGRDQQGLEIFAEDGALGHGGEAYASALTPWSAKDLDSVQIA
jgi:hypothetical protein